MSKSITKKTVLITGCSEGGIGYSLAVAFQKRGLHVFATTRNVSKMESLGSMSDVTLIALDVNSRESIANAVSTISAQTGGKLDYLINNAGIVNVSPLLDMDLDGAGREVFETNFWAPMAMIQAFAPLLIASKGTIVNNSSLTANIDTPSMTIYSASKGALTVMSRILRLELAPLGVKVLCLMTGAVKTNIMPQAPKVNLPEGSYYRPIEDKIAKMASTQPEAGTDPDVYARKVVADVLGGSSSKFGMIYRGFGSSLSWLLPRVLPEFVVDSIMTSNSGFKGFKVQ